VFFTWHFQGSLAIILMLAVLAGAVVSALLTIPETIMNYFKFKDLKNQKDELEKKFQADEKIIHEQMQQKVNEKPEDTIVTPQ
jgi:hypothetical protein